MLYAGFSVENIMQKHMKAIEKHGGPSVKIWVENHRSKVFYYQGSSDTDAFILGIQTEWQLQQMIRFGNKNLFALVSSFGVKKF